MYAMDELVAMNELHQPFSQIIWLHRILNVIIQ